MKQNKHSSMDRGMIRAAGEVRIELRLPVTMEVPEFSVAPILRQCFMNSAVEVVSRSVTSKRPELFLAVWLTALPELTLQSTLLGTADRLTLPITVTMTVSDRCRSSVRRLGKRSILEVPSLIDFSGSTATIRRTLAVTEHAASLSLSESWHVPPPSTTSLSTVRRTLSLDWATLMDLTIPDGNPEAVHPKRYTPPQWSEKTKMPSRGSTDRSRQRHAG